jgi:putative transposase
MAGHDKFKDIIVESLQFLNNEKRIILYGFAIMSNHIHVIWQAMAGHRY